MRRQNRLDRALAISHKGPVIHHDWKETEVNRKTVLTLATFVGVAIGLIWSRSMSYVAIPLILTAVILLHLLIPAKYNGHFATFTIMFFGGYLLSVLAENMLGEIPAWAAWTWLALSLTVSVFLPVPDFTRKNQSNAKPPAPNAHAS